MKLVVEPPDLKIAESTNFEKAQEILNGGHSSVCECIDIDFASHWIDLTLIGGLIPSSKAAKKDPVAALRTENR